MIGGDLQTAALSDLGSENGDDAIQRLEFFRLGEEVGVDVLVEAAFVQVQEGVVGAAAFAGGVVAVVVVVGVIVAVEGGVGGAIVCLGSLGGVDGVVVEGVGMVSCGRGGSTAPELFRGVHGDDRRRSTS